MIICSGERKHEVANFDRPELLMNRAEALLTNMTTSSTYVLSFVLQYSLFEGRDFEAYQ